MAKTFSGRAVIQRLVREYGFVVVSQRGSHVKLKKRARVTIVPLHKELAPGTLRSALRLAGIAYQDFLDSSR